MKTLKIWDDSPSERQLSEICRDLEAGQIMLWPTDTIYGIACDALNSKAIERVCRLKGINLDKTHLSIVCADISMAADYARFSNNVFMLLKHNIPGPFTFLCRAASSLPRAFKGRKTVGVRIPDCRTDIEIVKRLGHPVLTATIDSDDPDVMLSSSLIAELYDGRVDMMLEAEQGGTEPSTVVDCTTDDIEILRQGKGELQ